MEFDKSKVYTTVNADELKIGSKGYFADSLEFLKKQVEEYDENDKAILMHIQKEGEMFRFVSSKSPNPLGPYFLFYLLEEPDERKYRPYANTDEMIEDYLDRYNSFTGWRGNVNPMYCPLIWIKEKASNKKDLIVSFEDLGILIAEDLEMTNLIRLFNTFTYLDGTPCGKKI